MRNPVLSESQHQAPHQSSALLNELHWWKRSFSLTFRVFKKRDGVFFIIVLFELKYFYILLYNNKNTFLNDEMPTIRLDTPKQFELTKNKFIVFITVNSFSADFAACPYCEKVFTTTKDNSSLRKLRNAQAGLRRHVRLVHLKTMGYKCDICEHEFTQNSHLTRHHKTVHLKLKRFSCPVCGAAFGQKAYIKLHIRQLHPEMSE